MSEKVSTITLRLTAEEVTQLEILKNLTGKRTASEAIKHVVREYPRFCTHYKQEANAFALATPIFKRVRRPNCFCPGCFSA